ncbi:MAG TPA: Xaa-Pro peptidase family protein [Levilinea sp.]|nr:Xaa-Pro peptidase family protein [Levilinea sp.]
MKPDLDALMHTEHIDALLVTGPVRHNPYMFYLTGGGHITNADVIKKAGEPAILFHGPMERDEAAKTGLVTRSYSLYPMAELLNEMGGSRLGASALRYKRMLRDAGVTCGRVALYGRTDLGSGFATIMKLQELVPEIEFVGVTGESMIMRAMATKDASEIERIRKVGNITTSVVGQVADFLTTQKVKDGFLVWPDGRPIMLGEVKRRINLLLMENGAENPEDTIFAIGRDAGIPHSSGAPGDFIRLGQTIVFDIFPCEAGGGYFFDFTRTWCLGFAPDEVYHLYEDVLNVFKQIMQELEVGRPFSHFQERTCRMFEAMGHPSVMSTPETESGYVHSIGHGLGLHVHESPASGWSASPKDVLQPGSVITIEPGLYYPERGMGVRLENTVAVMPDGVFETLANYPLELVLPVRT